MFDADDTVYATGVDRNQRTGVEVLLDLARFRPAWHSQAACRAHPELSWFPERGDPPEAIDAARAVCRTCPVAEECRDFGLREGHGLWGGLTVLERRQLRRQRRQPAA